MKRVGATGEREVMAIKLVTSCVEGEGYDLTYGASFGSQR